MRVLEPSRMLPAGYPAYPQFTLGDDSAGRLYPESERGTSTESWQQTPACGFLLSGKFNASGNNNLIYPEV